MKQNEAAGTIKILSGIGVVSSMIDGGIKIRNNGHGFAPPTTSAAKTPKSSRRDITLP